MTKKLYSESYAMNLKLIRESVGEEKDPIKRLEETEHLFATLMSYMEESAPEKDGSKPYDWIVWFLSWWSTR